MKLDFLCVGIGWRWRLLRLCCSLDAQAYATNKAVLSEMGDTMPGYRILEGRWGVENMALAIPKGRDAGLPWLRQFAAQMQASGQLKTSIARAGLRGSVQP